VPGLTLLQKGPTDCVMSECDRETSIMRRLWSTRGRCTTEKKSVHKYKPVFSENVVKLIYSCYFIKIVFFFFEKIN
jgi:hypothetical protein